MALSNFWLEIFIPKFVTLTSSCLQILGKIQTGVFPIPRFLVKSFINKNYHSSRTNNDIDMKFGPLTKHDNRSMTTLKKFGDGVTLANYDVIVILVICGWIRAIWNPESGHIIYNSYIFIKSKASFYITKTKSRTKKF